MRIADLKTQPHHHTNQHSAIRNPKSAIRNPNWMADRPRLFLARNNFGLA